MNIEEFSKELARMQTFGTVRHSPLDDGPWLNQCASTLAANVREFEEFGCRSMRCFSEQLKIESTLKAKKYFIAKALEEVMESAYSIGKLVQSLPLLMSDTPEHPYVIKTILGLHERSEEFINRRLFELLVLVKHFEKTPDEKFFHHYLLLTEANEHASRVKDEQAFFGKSGQAMNALSDVLIQNIEKLELTFPELKTAWYLKQSPNYSKGRIFENYKQLFLELDGSVDDLEKLSLGFTYGALYSHASKLMHFTASEPYTTGFPDVREIASAALQRVFMSVCILRCLSILSDCQRSGGYSIIQIANQTYQDFGNGINRTMYQSFSQGDFVSIMDSLAEVTGEIVGKFDYKSYSVKFLSRQPQNADDSYIAAHLRAFATEQIIRDYLQSTAPELFENLNRRGVDEQAMLIREMAVFVWEQYLARLSQSASAS